ncbi:uncharacterized protein HMPREF1541_02154 [Cyphellophora europaea CBS 101466]|uniref:Protein HRI1 n=1 Tax=Cyphellophora europaea (strain CBS 101466) TaxID=1220924 RepID=W2S2Q9_CYPE1|nr:uncharacterized protein HMPREF1541_02154 [Cyphellophora europaea CBS 101466]ETN42996.1 hypothetical protein HMPREF1541_02154 [Cyphellophora europaea CBS 101466]
MAESNVRLPSISIRKGIAWGFSPPYEDTSTLVLTSPEGRFVDIRFPLDYSTLPGRKGFDHHPSYWSFSGRSITRTPQQGSFPAWPYATHSVWQHEIDSRGPGIVDEGDMFDLPNGDSMEVGVMRHPVSGEQSMYKEYWTSPKLAPEYGLGLFPCYVAETVAVQGDTGLPKGRIIRVGPHCQSIRATEPVDVERWTYTYRDEMHQWWDQARYGDLWPTGVSLKEESVSPLAWWLCKKTIQAGDEMDTGDNVWRVIEAWQGP